jgi:predicted neutral ceramidase superfamily lipid hydrolase
VDKVVKFLKSLLIYAILGAILGVILAVAGIDSMASRVIGIVVIVFIGGFIEKWLKARKAEANPDEPVYPTEDNSENKD